MDLQEVQDWISKNNAITELNAVMESIRVRRNILGLQAGLALQPGERVHFLSKSRGWINGTFQKQNTKNAKVFESATGLTWTVAPQLLVKGPYEINAKG